MDNAFFDKYFSDTDRERILLFGDTGSGKTYAIFKLAEYLQENKPDAHVYLMDADNGTNKIWKHEFPHVKNVLYKLVTNWRDVQAMIKESKAVITAQDWFCTDMIGVLWDMAQSFELHEVYGEGAGDFLIAARRASIESNKKNMPATLPQVDWGVVKKLHNDEFIQDVCTRWPCHVLCTTSADKLGGERENPDIQSFFASLGFKPDGEKRNPYRFETIMYIYRRGNGRYFTTIKDRSRPLFADEQFDGNLWTDYDTALIDGMAESFLSNCLK